ncbi:hypothetical protein F4810DRAFT_676121, partial [Camillea tinctor]
RANYLNPDTYMNPPSPPEPPRHVRGWVGQPMGQVASLATYTHSLYIYTYMSQRFVVGLSLLYISMQVSFFLISRSLDSLDYPMGMTGCVVYGSGRCLLAGSCFDRQIHRGGR